MSHYKRINNEIPELQKLYRKITVTYEIENPINIILYDPSSKTLPETLEFQISKDYPFTPPKIYRNNSPYLKSLPHITTEKYRKEIKKQFRFIGNCIHCDFIIKDNWSPAISIKHILLDMEKIEELRQIIYQDKYLQKIGIKYNIPKEITDMIHSFI
jgi:ubiquitin-protein ligase